MKTHLALLAAVACLHSAAPAAELVIDRVVIRKHPITPPYFAAMSVKAGDEEHSFHESKKAYGSAATATSEIEIRPRLMLKNVQLHSWGTFNLQLAAHGSPVTTANAKHRHSGRFEILSGSHDTIFIPNLHGAAFVYQIYWHAR
jgi:hypothetical protein